MPDINVWLALTWGSHMHSRRAWEWFGPLAGDEVLFCRFTQLGLLRLLTTTAVMSDDCLTVREAWAVYDRWLKTPQVELRREAAETDALFRRTTKPQDRKKAPKAIADCYLLATSAASAATLVTFDKGLLDLARSAGHDVLLLA